MHFWEMFGALNTAGTMAIMTNHVIIRLKEPAVVDFTQHNKIFFYSLLSNLK